MQIMNANKLNYIKMNALTTHLSEKLRELMEGDPWVTENFRDRVLSLGDKQAAQKIQPFHHSIGEIVNHMTAWRYFVIKKMQGYAEHNIIVNTDEDWPSMKSWKKTKEDFEQSQEELLHMINSFPDELLETTVPLRSYTFSYLLDGIVKHDYYHYGQIACILAAIKE